MASGTSAGAARERRAAERNQEGLKFYADWELERAVACFRGAVEADPDNAEYHLNLARTFARGGDYENATLTLGDYVRTEPDERLAERYERLFSSRLDEVERTVIKRMRAAEMGLREACAAIQMWLEYRIAVGRKPLSVRRPETWAAALDYTVRRVNFHKATLEELAGVYGVSPKTVQARHDDLVNTLDVMPADYRYYIGESNPLDRLVEAAQMLEQLDARFGEGQ
jgi:tetratricopeptide (TPR) repeat protein